MTMKNKNSRNKPRMFAPSPDAMGSPVSEANIKIDLTGYNLRIKRGQQSTISSGSYFKNNLNTVGHLSRAPSRFSGSPTRTMQEDGQ